MLLQYYFSPQGMAVVWECFSSLTDVHLYVCISLFVFVLAYCFNACTVPLIEYSVFDSMSWNEKRAVKKVNRFLVWLEILVSFFYIVYLLFTWESWQWPSVVIGVFFASFGAGFVCSLFLWLVLEVIYWIVRGICFFVQWLIRKL